MSESLPKVNPRRFPALRESDLRVLETGTLIGRIYTAGGQYATGWSAFRAWGPTTSRFDHQPLPVRAHPSRRVLYAAPAVVGADGDVYPVLKTCLAECYRDRGMIEMSRDAPYFALFEISRPLRLLDLGGEWLARAGGNGAISSGHRSRSRDWARAIYRKYDDLDGVIYPSSHIPVARSVALWERAEDALPDRASLNEPLIHIGLRAAIETYAADLGLPLS